ncbi:SMAD/FHA domain-containing protein, partial [Suillus subalutaceus]|uniref:SMAD/FHA domain-containing protein n=1 Tax=Suillus subalutaceus TaxID=48586 RepID=UPI001B886A9E
SNPLIHRICLVPHVDSNHTFHFEPISCDLRYGDIPVSIGRFTSRSDRGEIVFKSKVVSHFHAEIWVDNGKFYIKDTKSSSGTFLNHIRLSPAGSESAPHQLKHGDIVQLGVDYQGGTEDIWKSVRIRIEVGRELQ